MCRKGNLPANWQCLSVFNRFNHFLISRGLNVIVMVALRGGMDPWFNS